MRDATGLCIRCGEPIQRVGRRGPRRDYCGRVCRSAAYRARKRERTYGNCRLCGTALAAIRSSRYFCGSKCRQSWWNAENRRRRPTSEIRRSGGICPECGDAWIRCSDRDCRSCRPGSRRYCTPACTRRANLRTKNHRRRLRIGTPAETITIQEIGERDSWRCHLCRRRVSRRTASLDHLIPIAAGGPHTRTNVALAHRRCNTRRGARGLAQLRLIA